MKASGINPFDRAYRHLQHSFDNEAVKLLSEILQLNVTLIHTPLVTDLSIYEGDPDSWVLEQIINGSAEMSSTSLILTSEISKMVDYSYAIGSFRPQAYYKARSLRESSNIYLTPFSSKLWICLITVALLLTLALIFILSKEAKLPHQLSYDVIARIIDLQEDRDEEWTDDLQNSSEESLLQREKWEIGEILLVCLGALCQQGSARDPSTNAARLLILVFFTLAVVGYTAYSASIISLISLFPSTEKEEFKTVETFSQNYKTLLHSTYKIHHYLKLTFSETEFTETKKALNKAIEGKAVFIGDRDVSITFLHDQNYGSDVRCTLGRAFLGVEHQRVFALKNNSIYKKSINHSILRLKQFGLLERERKRIFNLKAPCTLRERSSGSNFISFNHNDVRPVLNFFKLGLIMSLMLLIMENLVYNCPKGIQTIFSIKKKTKGKETNKHINI